MSRRASAGRGSAGRGSAGRASAGRGSAGRGGALAAGQGARQPAATLAAQPVQQQVQQEREPRPQAQQQREPHRRTVEIEGELTIHTAAEHRGALLAVIEAEGMLALDLSAVTELDTAGLQLLLLAQREADHLGGRLQITGASRSVLDVLAIAHLDSTLGHLGGPTGAEARR